jgi:hypothetical protein
MSNSTNPVINSLDSLASKIAILQENIQIILAESKQKNVKRTTTPLQTTEHQPTPLTKGIN